MHSSDNFMRLKINDIFFSFDCVIKLLQTCSFTILFNVNENLTCNYFHRFRVYVFVPNGNLISFNISSAFNLASFYHRPVPDVRFAYLFIYFFYGKFSYIYSFVLRLLSLSIIWLQYNDVPMLKLLMMLPS